MCNISDCIIVSQLYLEIWLTVSHTREIPSHFKCMDAHPFNNCCDFFFFLDDKAFQKWFFSLWDDSLWRDIKKENDTAAFPESEPIHPEMSDNCSHGDIIDQWPYVSELFQWTHFGSVTNELFQWAPVFMWRIIGNIVVLLIIGENIAVLVSMFFSTASTYWKYAKYMYILLENMYILLENTGAFVWTWIFSLRSISKYAKMLFR